MGRISLLAGVAALAVMLGASELRAEEKKPEEAEAAKTKAKEEAPAKKEEEKKFRDFAELTKGAEKIEGLFTLHRKDEHLYAEIKPEQLNQPLLAPIAIARGMAMAGHPLNFGDEWVLVFRRAGDKVQVVRRNIHYRAAAGTPLERAVKQNYTDSVLLALPILSLNQANHQSVVIDLADIFLTDFAQLGVGSVDRNRTTWHKVKAFPNNLELQVEATFNSRWGGMFFLPFDDGVADHRGITLVLHYSLVKMPDSGYKPRLADDRVGHFLSALKDFGQADPDTNFVRQINRWRLEKADPKAKLSPPKRRIVWWVEETVPHEYRPFVEEGILEWNKAFEKIGFRNALEVRWQDVDHRDDFDPEDINYCTFRWITTPGTFAMSCLRANPITGEMIDGDVIFDASWIRYWKQEYAFLAGEPPASARDGEGPLVPLDLGQVLSPIMAVKQGFGLPLPLANLRGRALAEGRPGGAAVPQLVPMGWSPAQWMLQQRLTRGQFTGCRLNVGMRPELALAALALAATDKDQDDKDKDKDKDDTAGKLPEELIGQMIKMVVMHEVGHSLGLRHNFHASTMLTAEQLNDTAITRVKGQSGSVMDYNPMNLAPKGQKQGDYTTTTIGPYDYWAIEYAYKPIDGDEAAERAELKKIADRSPEPDLVYSTDEDMFMDDDPLVNAFDLGSDPGRFAQDRILLAAQLMKDLDSKVVRDGESWARLRHAFSILLGQWGNGAYLVSSHIGGQYVARDHRAAKGARDPIVPVPGTKQRESLKFLADQILSDRAFRFSPALLRKLASERWYHWGNETLLFFGGGVDYPIHEQILGIQRIVLGRCLDPGVLARLQNQELQADVGSEPLRMSEVFRALTDGIWSECADAPAAEGKPTTLACSTIRRNLQREHLRRLCTMVLGNRRSPYEDLFGFMFFFGSQPVPADARSLARLHLKEIGDRLDKVLAQKEVKLEDTTRAHFEECRQRISKVLEAGFDNNEP
ncbi:MAG: zinc-dependent metalloprotease [Isosphaeraceae bacterium]|nr:zinc-dependent metalloprotease [Isosphaeraceae bacterium]